jgi:predicted enzyme related to lactoylglutathione lyase
MKSKHFTKYKMFIFSENVDELVKFYNKVLELNIVGELKLPKDYGYSLKVAEGYDLWIANHSGLKGKNKDKFRNLLNLYTEDLSYWYNKIKGIKEVEIIQEPVEMSRFNPSEKERRVFTFTDPEGNLCQIMGIG